MTSPYRGGAPEPDDEPPPRFKDEASTTAQLVTLGVAGLGASGLGYAAFGSLAAAAAAAAICIAPAAAAGLLGPSLQRVLARRRARYVVREVLRLEDRASDSEGVAGPRDPE